MKNTKWLLCILFLFPISLVAQRKNFDLAEDFKKLEIPFEFEHNFIIVNLRFNNSLPLRFIFDTGAEHTMLTKKEISDILHLQYRRRFTVLGADMTTRLTAFLVQGIRMDIGELTALNHSILVLAEDYFNFEKLAGINVHGIIGADIMNRFVVEINYQRQIITFHDPRYYKKPTKNYTEIPITVKKHKPYLVSKAIFQKQHPHKNLTLLLDTGAGLTILLNANNLDSLNIPPKTIKTKIGTGLGGSLEGFFGRLDEISFGDYEMKGVLTNFQYLPPLMDSLMKNDRDGIVGNTILSRFKVTIDYINQKLYLEPNRKYNREFIYDRSGLLLVSGGTGNLRKFIISYVVPNSPADEAGIKKGDILKNINRLPVSVYSLADIYRKFQKRPGKKIRLIIKRNGEKMLFKFRLRILL